MCLWWALGKSRSEFSFTTSCCSLQTENQHIEAAVVNFLFSNAFFEAAAEVKIAMMDGYCLSPCLPLTVCVSESLFSLCATHPLILAACLLEGPLLTTPKNKQGLFSPLTPFPPILMYVLCFFYTLVYMYYVCAYIQYTHSKTRTGAPLWSDPSPPAVTSPCKPLNQTLAYSQASKGTPHAWWACESGCGPSTSPLPALKVYIVPKAAAIIACKCFQNKSVFHPLLCLLPETWAEVSNNGTNSSKLVAAGGTSRNIDSLFLLVAN